MEHEVVPVTPDRWEDLVALFGPNGAYAGCWCLWWRQTSREHDAGHGDPNREAMRGLVTDGREPGLLAYDDSGPVGWVSVAPRPEFGRVLRSPLFRPADPDDPDDRTVWSVVCFYVPRTQRGRGLTAALLDGAVAHAVDRGASALEGYPVVPGRARSADLFPGVPSVFERAGFTEVAAPSPTRRIVRREL